MSFIHKDFMLQNETARKLYHTYAEQLPIIDYHCHLSPQMIAEDYHFSDAAELFLGGDHYKWRVMRSHGVPEKYITGDASGYEKFLKWAEVVPALIGNPLYHWTHLELARYFDIYEPLCPETADGAWNRIQELLAKPEFGARGLIRRSNVKVVCTTDEPMDTLEYHRQIKESGYEVQVLPAFRPDKAVEIQKETFLPYMEKMGVSSYDQLLSVLRERIGFFHENGCRIADSALETVPFQEGDPQKVFDRAINGEAVTAEEADVFKTAVLQVCAKEYARLGWAMQLHIGALRNNNSAMYRELGADTGYDSMNDLCVAAPLAKFLNSLEQTDELPKTILYTLNPKDNGVLSTIMGCFQKAPVRGKLQFGSGWWFNDQKDGMRQQMRDLGNLGVLSNFIGMLTDSRSFVSYPRHEYFRRILCQLFGEWVEAGEYPAQEAQLGKMIQNICYYNAKEYFGF